ncbi:hypothetical protein A4V04_01265 [Burkholderiales bacterium YL45]|uniref:Uncharacterized protein n=1 Tax=Turicimonas muris TaxID=1796652 RepID=A0A227KR57_9BURK|nr:hypothetical protein A4V04_01265 [Burkholderiales bacterium YL45]OXE51000.1 hypothetical protein ADH67_01500 [Turicimonas muris]
MQLQERSKIDSRNVTKYKGGTFIDCDFDSFKEYYLKDFLLRSECVQRKRKQPLNSMKEFSGCSL